MCIVSDSEFQCQCPNSNSNPNLSSVLPFYFFQKMKDLCAFRKDPRTVEKGPVAFSFAR